VAGIVSSCAAAVVAAVTVVAAKSKYFIDHACSEHLILQSGNMLFILLVANRCSQIFHSQSIVHDDVGGGCLPRLEDIDRVSNFDDEESKQLAPADLEVCEAF
jgi:hypothetical protein